MVSAHARSRILVYCTLTALVCISTFAVWLPFLFKVTNWMGIPIESSNFQYVYRHFDGLFYIVAAKSLYNPAAILDLKVETTLPPGYFAAHFPLYPLIIRFFAPVLGYLKSMLFVNLLFTSLLAGFFYHFVTHFKLSKHPLLLTSILLFLPRFLVVRSVGAPESLFLLLILGSLYFFEKENFLVSGILGGLSVVTRSPGVLLFGAYALVFLERYVRQREFRKEWIWTLLIPAGLLSVFTLYAVQYGDLWAYFKSGDNFHLSLPFSAFNHAGAWVQTAWLEDILLYFFIYLLAVIKLKDSRYRSFFYFALVYFTATTLIQHRDVSRYSLPLWPLALIAFQDFFTSKAFRVAFVIMLAGIYMYAWNFMSQNVMPVSDWTAFL